MTAHSLSPSPRAARAEAGQGEAAVGRVGGEASALAAPCTPLAAEGRPALLRKARVYGDGADRQTLVPVKDLSVGFYKSDEY